MKVKTGAWRRAFADARAVTAGPSRHETATLGSILGANLGSLPMEVDIVEIKDDVPAEQEMVVVLYDEFRRQVAMTHAMTLQEAHNFLADNLVKTLRAGESIELLKVS